MALGSGLDQPDATLESVNLNPRPGPLCSRGPRTHKQAHFLFLDVDLHVRPLPLGPGKPVLRSWEAGRRGRGRGPGSRRLGEGRAGGRWVRERPAAPPPAARPRPQEAAGCWRGGGGRRGRGSGVRCRGGSGETRPPFGPQPGSPPRVPRRAVGRRHQQGQHCSRRPRVRAPAGVRASAGCGWEAQAGRRPGLTPEGRDRAALGIPSVHVTASGADSTWERRSEIC